MSVFNRGTNIIIQADPGIYIRQGIAAAEAAEASAEAAAISAESAATDNFRTLRDVATLLANTSIVYGAGAAQVAAGDIMQTRAEGFSYEVAASAATDQHVTTAGGVKLYVLRGADGKFAAEAFGILGDNATDNTSRYAAAITGVHGAGGGVLKFGAGVFVGTLALTTALVDTVNLEGTFGATVMRAATDGAFAVTLKNNQFAPEPFFTPLIRNIGFSGRNDAGVAKYRCGLFAPRRVHLENVVFYDCLIGFVSTDNYYGHWIGLNVSSCDVGVIQGTYGVGAETITGLINGAGSAVSVTLPEPANNAAGHSGNKAVFEVRINACRIGWAAVGASNFSPNNLLVKPTIESCTIGFLVRQGFLSLVNPWLEANSTSGTVTFMGQTFNAGCIVASAPVGLWTFTDFGGKVIVDGGRLERLYSEAGGTIEVSGKARIFNSPVADAGGVVALDNVSADALCLSSVVNRPEPTYGSGRQVQCFVPPKYNRVWGAQPRNGRIIISEDFSGVAYSTARLSYNSGDFNITWGSAGGFFSEQACASVAAANNTGFNLLLSSLFTTGRYYAYILAINTPAAITFNAVNLAGTWATPSNSIVTPTNEWFTLAMVSKWTATPGGANPRVNYAGISGTINILHGGLMVVEFLTAADAANFCGASEFYMTEAP